MKRSRPKRTVNFLDVFPGDHIRYVDSDGDLVLNVDSGSFYQIIIKKIDVQKILNDVED